uniref:Uncharacterized protein n=1 Tax=Kuenenia stuttgartiensis TaxID=174633 RepID=Q1PVV1_KUEST|nr:unknown protein [Candidatus Kuenenia stuttgartiensis]
MILMDNNVLSNFALIGEINLLQDYSLLRMWIFRQRNFVKIWLPKNRICHNDCNQR